jgi:selenocysteine-specific elongation factor
MKHVVIGTAGHIDHGKSALVLALTGTDPDRLQEEKARGITIDLGFAHTVEDGIALSFVDVPGHERFVRNMLAGVGGMDLVMLHVAADESVMPQTREHFDICRLLRVPAGLVVMTKSDLADPSTLEVVRLEVQDLVAGSFLEGAPILAVSARTGAGVPDLRRALASLARSARTRPSEGPPRLPIDRVFSMKGFGTVVTGTLIGGRLRIDDEVVCQPSGRTAKVRGLQVHGERRDEAIAGQRVAVNLAGIEVADAARGDTLTQPDAVSVTRSADVRIGLLRSAKPLRHGARVRFHQGTRELLGRIALTELSEVRPGASASARIHLEAPAVLVRGDRFILRAYSPLTTIGGGTVLDPLPPRRGVRTLAGIARFARLAEEETRAAVVLTMIEEAGLGGLPVVQLVGRAGVQWAVREQVVAELDGRVVQIGPVLVSMSHLGAAEDAMLAAVAQHHAEHPVEEGMPREELRERVFGKAPAAVFEHALRRLVERARLVARERVAVPGRRVALSADETRTRDAILQMLSEAGLTPPDPVTLATRIAVNPQMFDRIVDLLVRQKAIVRAGDLLFGSDVLARLKTDIRSLKQPGASATLDVGTFKDRYNVSRKYAIPLLEFLDRERITRRVGDVRHIL